MTTKTAKKPAAKVASKADLDLCYLPAVEALRLFRARKLSPVELMQTVIDRAEAIEPKINAFTFKYFDEAMARARRAEAKYAKPGGRAGALDGLPIAIKDESYVTGYPTSNASFILENNIATHTSPTNERILKAGAIMFARTATPEFSCAGFTHSRMWGVTRNPWNREFTPGGSSGGSAASLAAGSTTLATGSDIGGSIRIPASTCGLAGFKPPYGRNPDDPPFNLDHYNHTGPLARTVADCILLQNVMAGPHPRDIATIRPKLTLPTTYEDIKGWRIAYSLDLGFFEVDKEVRRNTEKALNVFRALGAEVEEVELSWTWDVYQAGIAHLSHLFGGFLSQFLDTHRDKLNPYVIEIGEFSRKSTVSDYLAGMVAEGKMYAELGALLEQYKLLVCPTLAVPSIPADFDMTSQKIHINGKEVHPWIGWAMTTVFNMMSRCPVLSLPSGRAKNGVPTGIQLVGRTFSDGDVFRAASAYEAEIGPWFAKADMRPAL